MLTKKYVENICEVFPIYIYFDATSTRSKGGLGARAYRPGRIVAKCPIYVPIWNRERKNHFVKMYMLQNLT